MWKKNLSSLSHQKRRKKKEGENQRPETKRLWSSVVIASRIQGRRKRNPTTMNKRRATGRGE